MLLSPFDANPSACRYLARVGSEALTFTLAQVEMAWLQELMGADGERTHPPPHTDPYTNASSVLYYYMCLQRTC